MSCVYCYVTVVYVCIPCGFLVINVCNQGKTLCSPCISLEVHFNPLLISVPVSCYQPSYQNSFHLAITFQFVPTKISFHRWKRDYRLVTNSSETSLDVPSSLCLNIQQDMG
jgi:hypothetical protein